MMRVRVTGALLSFSLALVLFCVHAQQPPDSQLTIRKQVDLVLVDILLTDAKGNSLKGLRAKDIELLDDNTPQELAHFSQDEIPLAIALVVDASSSMRPGMEFLRQGLIRALPTLKPDDRVALFAFDDEAKLRVEMSRDFDMVAEKIRRLDGRGGTNLNEAVYQAAEYLRDVSAAPARRVIVVVSDTVSRPGNKPAEKALLESEVSLFVIRVPGWEGTNYFNRKHLEQLVSMGYLPDIFAVDRLASQSGGFVMDVERPEGIQAGVEHMFQMLRSRYTLGFYPNPPGAPGSIRRIEIRLKNNNVEQVMSGALLAFRNRYRVPPEKAGPPRSAPGGVRK